MNNKIDYNHHGKLINLLNMDITSYISKIVFSLDFIDISIRINDTYSQLLSDIGSQWNHIKSIKEKHCKNPIWKDLFIFRNYFSLNNGGKAWVMTEKAQALRHFDGIIRLPHPTPDTIRQVEKDLEGLITLEDFWVSKMEPTFDIVTNEPKHRDLLQAYLNQTMYLKHGKDPFKRGEDKITIYINFRTSIKQTRIYEKDIIDGMENGYQSLRFEFPIKRRKLFSEEIEMPSDILKYNMNILDEIGFYGVDEVKLKRSLMDYDTDHYFSELITTFINRKGFHAAQLWSRRMKECPIKCDYRAGETCKLMPNGNRIASRHGRFVAIQECDRSRSIANFRVRYCREIKEMESLKNMMFKSFESWKKS